MFRASHEDMSCVIACIAFDRCADFTLGDEMIRPFNSEANDFLALFSLSVGNLILFTLI